MAIPAYRKAQCEFCDGELDIDADGVHQYTKGWVKNRTGGGGHGISLAEEERRWAHGHCIAARVRGTVGQKSMF